MHEPRPHELPEASELSSELFELLEGIDGTHPMALDAEDLALATSGQAAGPATLVEEPPMLMDQTLSWEQLEERAQQDSQLAPALPLRLRLENLLRASWLPARLVACIWMAYVLVFNLSVVRGSSMAPGIHDGDRIVVDEFSYMFTDIARGDIVVLRYPLDPNLDYIKRVVGLPGDLIVMSNGKVWINGEQIEERYTLESDLRSDLTEVVKEGHYFVLGDNRLHSSDSREFGQVAAGLVRGKVDLRLWPFERIGILD